MCSISFYNFPTKNGEVNGEVPHTSPLKTVANKGLFKEMFEI